MSREKIDRRPPPVASTHAALRRLFGSGSVYTLALVVQLSAALLVVPIVTRVLFVAQYGTVAAAMVVMTVVSILGAAGLPEAASRTYFRGEEGPRDAHRLVVGTAAVALVVALVAEVTGPLWAPVFSLEYTAVVRLAVWGGAATAVMLAGQSLLRAVDRVWSFLVVSAVASLGAQGLGLALTVADGTPAAYMAGLAAGTAVAAALSVLLTGSLRHGLPRPPLMRKGLVLGLPLILHSLAVFMLLAVDRIVIASVLGLGATGRYQVAYQVGSVGVALITALNQAWIPLLLGAEPHRRSEILAASSRAVHQFAAIVAGAVALATPLGLLFAAPPAYDRAELVPVAAVVAFSILPYATLSTFFNVVFVAGRTRIMAIAAPVAALLNVGLNFLLLPMVGLIGASIATVAAYAVLAAIIVAASRQVERLPGTLRTALLAWAVAAPVVAAGALLPPGPAGTATRVALGGALLLALVRLAFQIRRGPAAGLAGAAG